MKIRLPYLPGFCKKRWFQCTLVILTILAGFFLWQYLQKQKNGVETFTVARQGIEQVITASGKITAKDQATLTFQTVGRLEWVGVKKGDWVQKWQAIASLNQQDLEKSMKKKLLDYMNYRWDYEQYSDDYNVRGRPLDIVPLTDAEKRIVQKAQFDLDKSVLDVEIAELAKKYALLVTPVEGIVIEATNEQAGINIYPTTTKYVIVDPNSLRFTAEVEELDIGLISANLPATITLDAFPNKTIAVQVDSIEFTAVETVSGNTAYNVHFPLAYNESYRLDMNGSVDITVAKKSHVLVVPIAAVSVTAEGQEVTVQKNNKSETVKITTGLETETYYEVVSGLAEGDVVILP